MDDSQRVIDSVHIRFLKSGKKGASNYLLAKIIVTNTGKIEIVSLENKFPPIHLKAANVIKPKKPQAKNATWIVLDIIPNFEAMYVYVNIQAGAPSELEDLYNTLMIAWTPKKSDNFNDDDSFSVVPVFVPRFRFRSNKRNVVESTAEGGRSARANITVEPEGSPPFRFNTDFAKPSSSKNRESSEAFKGMFDDYGIGNTNNAQPLRQVHAKPAPTPRLCAPETNKEREKVLEVTAELKKVRKQWADEVDKLKAQLNEERQKSAKLRQDNKRNQLIRETIVLDDPDEPPVKRRAEEESASSPEVVELQQRLNQSEEKFQKLCDVARRDKEALQARVDFLETLVDSKEGILKDANKVSVEDELKKKLETEREQSAKQKNNNELIKGQLLQLSQQVLQTISALLETPEVQPSNSARTE